MSNIPSLPESGFVRLSQILGKPNAVPPTPPIIPVSKSTWWNGVKSGRYPEPVKLSERVTAWRADDIRALLAKVCQESAVIACEGVASGETIGKPTVGIRPTVPATNRGSK